MPPIISRLMGSFRRKSFGPQSFVSGWLNPDQDSNLLKRYKGYVYACVSAIAESVAKIEFNATRVLPNGDLQKISTHPLLTLLNNPNPTTSKFQLIEGTQTHIELTGDAFWYMEIGEQTGRPKSIYLLNPALVEVVPDKDAQLPTVLGYTYDIGNGTRMPLDKDEVVHFKMPNPLDPYRGLGTVEAGIIYIMTEQYGAEFTRNYIYNNAMPAGIVGISGEINRDAFEAFKRQWKSEYGNLRNAGKTAFVRGADVTFTKVGTTLSESALKDLKDMNRDDIMTMFRVSKPILGILDDVNLASAKTAAYIFQKNVVDTKQMRIVDTLQTIMDRWNTKNLEYQLGYESQVPADTEAKLAYYAAALSPEGGWMTPNEVRIEEDLEEIPGGDDLWRPLAVSSVGQTVPEPNNSAKFIKRTVRKELDYQAKENFRLSLMKNQKVYAARFQTEVRSLLEAQKRQILRNLAQETKAFEEASFDAQAEAAKFISALTPIQYELLKQQGPIALAFAGADELEFQVSERVRKVIGERMARMAENFNDETRLALTKTLQEGFAANESIDQIKKRVTSVYSTAKGYRAERIARTETIYAGNAATNEAYAQTGYVVAEEWYANPGACEFCEALSGKTVSLSENFVSLGETLQGKEGGEMRVDYTDIGFPPAHVNCECTTLPVRE